MELRVYLRLGKGVGLSVFGEISWEGRRRVIRV